MDRKRINSIVALLTMIFTGWGAHSTFREANISEAGLKALPGEISKNIKLDQDNHNYSNSDTINISVENYDLVFKMKIQVKDSLFGLKFRGFEVGQVDYTNTEFGITTFKLIENQLDIYFKNRSSNDNVYLIINARGLADDTKVKPNTYWWGETIWDVEYYKDDDVDLQNKKCVDFIKQHTLLTNEHFAVLRAYFIVRRLRLLYPNKKNQILIVCKECREVGPEYRGCDLQIVVKNTLKREYYDELNWGARKIIDWGLVKQN